MSRIRPIRTIAVVLVALGATIASSVAVYAEPEDDHPTRTIQDLGNLTFGPKKARYSRLDSNLNQMAAQQLAIPQGASLRSGLSVPVTIRVQGDVQEIVGFLRLNGAVVANVGEDYIEATMPAQVLPSLAAQSNVLRVDTMISPQPAVVTSQGTGVHRSDIWN